MPFQVGWQFSVECRKARKVMHFGKKNQEHVYHMNGHKLHGVTTEKELGLWISHDLKASQQHIQAYSKANTLLGVLNRTIQCKDVGNLVCFYKSLTRPHLEFCTAAWSSHYVKDKFLIERIQRQFTKMIPHLKNVSYEE